MGMCAAEHELPDRRTDPIRSDDEVIRASRTICEGDVHRVILLTQRCQRRAKPDPDTRALQEDAMKITTSNAHTRTHRLPELCHVNLRQLSTGVIQDSLLRHADGSSQHLIGKTKRVERTNAISGEIEASTARWPRCGPLYDF
jgi:hypothetical protein